jgi:hypothetical protein
VIPRAVDESFDPVFTPVSGKVVTGAVGVGFGCGWW